MAAQERLRRQQRAEALAATLPPLMVAAERVASTVAQGVHGRRRVGMGESFWQFRRYQPGDQIQSIDWRQTGKTQAVYIRELEWEASQTVWLWRDASPSMAYRSSPELPTKRERAEILLLALGSLLNRAGERIALLGGGAPPAAGRANLSRLAVALEAAGSEVEPMPDLVPRHAEIVLIGDFLGPLQDIAKLVSGCAQRAVRGHMLQVLDPAEATLPFAGRIRFEGLEGELPALIPRVESVHSAYLERLKAQQDGLHALARGAGWSFAVHRTDKPPQAALLGLYGALSLAPIAGAAREG